MDASRSFANRRQPSSQAKAHLTNWRQAYDDKAEHARWTPHDLDVRAAHSLLYFAKSFVGAAALAIRWARVGLLSTARAMTQGAPPRSRMSAPCDTSPRRITIGVGHDMTLTAT